MGLKIICDGAFSTGKTIFAATMAEVGPIGVCDTEQRWQYLTVPHATITPRTEPPAGLLDLLVGPGPMLDSQRANLREAWLGVFRRAYAHPRQLKQGPLFLPKTTNPIWLLQDMDPIAAWNVTRVWALDPSITGLVKDSESVYWDVLQDLREDDERKGGLTWAPIKRTNRRMIYTLLKSQKDWVLVAHTQEKMNKAMEVIGRVPWVEKKGPHWADIGLRFTMRPGETPRVEVIADKILGGKNGALKIGKVLVAPTFKQVMDLTEVMELVETPRDTMEAIEARAKVAVERVAGTAYQPSVDSDPKGA